MEVTESLLIEEKKYVPFGGPAGGDGGKGASVVFEVDEGLRTLLDFRYQRHFKAKQGENGQSSNMHGKNAEDLVLKVPPGTIIKSVETEEVLADLVEDGQRAIVARGAVVVVVTHVLLLHVIQHLISAKMVSPVRN